MSDARPRAHLLVTLRCSQCAQHRRVGRLWLEGQHIVLELDQRGQWLGDRDDLGRLKPVRHERLFLDDDADDRWSFDAAHAVCRQCGKRDPRFLYRPDLLRWAREAMAARRPLTRMLVPYQRGLDDGR
jgi:hypothetical protein